MAQMPNEEPRVEGRELGGVDIRWSDLFHSSHARLFH